MKSSRRRRFSRSQMKTLVETMEVNTNLNKGALGPHYTSAQRHSDWTALCEQLNKDGGAVKTVEKWQKTWSDYKSEIKKRHRGLLSRSYLSPIEERVVMLMGLDSSTNADSPGGQSLELEISKVESLKGLPLNTPEMEEPTNGLTNLEFSNPSSVIVKEFTLIPVTPLFPVTTIKTEPEELPKILLEASEPSQPEKVPKILLEACEPSQPEKVSKILPEASELPPTGSEPKNLLEANEPSQPERVPGSTLEANEPSQPKGVPKTLLEANEPSKSETVVQPRPLQGSSDNSPIPEQTIEHGSPSVNKRRKRARSIVFNKLSAEGLVKAQTATAEALQTVAKALETMAENQRVQLAIEERRTVLLEKFINIFALK